MGFDKQKALETALQQLDKQFGKVTRQDITYNAYRASRNLSGREMHVQEYLFLLEKVR